MLPPGTSQAPPLYPVLETRFSSLTLLILSLLLSRNCGSSHAPTSFTGSVLTPGCSNTTRVHFACSIFLVGISQPGIGVGAGIVPRRNTYLWAMHAVSAAQEYVCVGGGVPGSVCMEGGCLCMCTVRFWAGAGSVPFPGPVGVGVRVWGQGPRKDAGCANHQEGLVAAVS